MAKLQDIVVAIQGVLASVPGVVTVCDSKAPENLDVEDFPVVVFAVGGLGATDRRGAKPDEVAGRMDIYHLTLAPAGPAATRDLMEATYAALHRVHPTAAGWTDVQLHCIRRGSVEKIGEADEEMLGQVDTYEIRAGSLERIMAPPEPGDPHRDVMLWIWICIILCLAIPLLGYLFTACT